MKIKHKLTLQFTAVVAIILMVFTIVIFFFSTWNRNSAFYKRLKNNASTIAGLMINSQKVDSTLLLQINKNTINFLSDEQMEIYDTNFTLLYAFNKDTLNPLHSNFNLKKIKASHEIKQEIDDVKIIGFTYPETNPNLIVVTSAKDEFSKEELKRLKRILIYGFLASILIVVLVGYFYSIQALKPISEIIKQIKKINSDKLHKRVYTNNTKDEIGELTNNFNQMLDRLEDSFELQKNYVANVSHEMRTPLTSVNGEIEVALMNDYSKEEFRQTFESVHGEILYLTTLTNGFLELAETSLENSRINKTKLRVDDLIYEVKEEVIKRHPERIIDIDFLVGITDDETLSVNGKKYLLKILIRNIIDNGCKYSENKKVTIQIDATNEFLILSFKDRGYGIPEEDLPKIMEAFYRSKTVINKSGYGLGLYIARKIVTIHNGKIEIESYPGYGTNVKVFIPFK
mgnify:CR=1 FL=1